MVQASRSLVSVISSILLINPASARYAYKHEAREIERRQLDIRPYTGPPGGETSGAQILAYVTPSPGAKPIPILTQSQPVTSYVPQFTLCELPPVAEVLVTPIPTTTTAPYKNYTVSIPSGNGTCTTIYSPTVTTVCATILTGLAEKYTVSNCEQEITFSTIFGYVLETAAPIVTTISVSSPPTLQPRDDGPANITQLGNSTINPGGPIDNSSSPFNTSIRQPNNSISSTPTYLLSTITPPPRIQTLTTYLLAPWTQLLASTPPSSVTQKVCHASLATTSCLLEYQSYTTTLLTLTTSTTTQVDLTTTVSGPSQIMVETFRANISDAVTTFSLSTGMVVLWEVEVESTVAVGVGGGGVSTTDAGAGGVSTEMGPTVYQTRTVAFASETGTSTLSTSTTTLRITRTVVVPGTTTVTLPTTLSSDTTDAADPTDAAVVSYTTISASVSSAPAAQSVFTAPAGQSSIDAASVLGLEGR
ncbi:hypothetical protein BDV97DRAFT_402460 [Delphinella strobiligena]|nr:hypothetical protein BDV97DRAFT_402460 [Delphinella strobiligena]